MDKILTVFTGGTVGSDTKNAVINVDDSVSPSLIDTFCKRFNLDVDFDIVSPYTILSENLLASHWESLHATIIGCDLTQYKGIIITHGTDTLPYSTSAFSYLLCGIDLPVVFISDNYVISHPLSNAADNFANAVHFILNSGLCGVYNIFKNSAEQNVVHLGTRLTESDPVCDQFNSYRSIDFGHMDGYKFIHNDNPLNPNTDKIKAVCCDYNKSPVAFDNSILYISPFPGLDYNMFNFENSRPAAVLHRLYHSSTACVAHGHHSLINFTEKCRSLGIDVYFLDCRHFYDNDVYESCKQLKLSSALPLTGISVESALAKLWIAYNQKPTDQQLQTDYNYIYNFMKRNVWFEYVI